MPEWTAIKRAVDVALAGAGLVVTAPALALAAVAIKLDSPGPVLFAHERIGRDRRAIRTLKLRTMADGARGPQITAGGDPRVTRVGRVLRRTKLDELPQLWNVVRGDMSLVGPRPEVRRYTDLYRPEWERVFTVRPGLTDPASVAFRDEEALLAAAHDRERAYTEVLMPMKLELALAGVTRSSPLHDLALIGRTLLAMLGRTTAADAAAQAEARRRIAALESESS